MYSRTVDTPIGPLTVRSDGCAVVSVRADGPCEDRPDPVTDLAARELGEYFAGKRREFTVPIAPRGTEFQMLVWDALRRIPFGSLRTYGELARELGRPGGARAVGMACHANPVLILVPCHRVVGADGSLTGFAAGIERKRQLLRLEKAGSFETV